MLQGCHVLAALDKKAPGHVTLRGAAHGQHHLWIRAHAQLEAGALCFKKMSPADRPPRNGLLCLCQGYLLMAKLIIGQLLGILAACWAVQHALHGCQAAGLCCQPAAEPLRVFRGRSEHQRADMR